MAKYAFNHDTDQLTGAFGIKDERFTEIVKTIRHAQIDCDNVLEIYEQVLNRLDPQNMVEAAFIGYSIAKCQDISSPLLSMLAALKSE